MKAHLQQLLDEALARLRAEGVLPAEAGGTVAVERARDARHGDFATNAALVLAKAAGLRPRELAERIVAALPDSPRVAAVEIAGPGFVNFRLAPGAWLEAVRDALAAGERWGHGTSGGGRRVQVEFVSANPTGPLHVGHGRGAAYGDSLANLLAAAGWRVHREYYVNDAGRQMDILAVSVWLRYLELCGEPVAFPDAGYQGDYVYDIAADLHRADGEAHRRPWAEVARELPPDAPDGDRERRMDALIARARELLGPEGWARVHRLGLEVMLDLIRRDLEAFGVRYDDWFSERGLVEGGAVARAVERLRAAGHVYERDGALWFRASAFGDEKDRVLVRESGQPTYFASDVAYHLNKAERGFEHMIDVWGADHHGYVPRLRAALAALGIEPERLEVRLVQFAVLYRGGEKVQMSTRSGEFVTLRELREEVGTDAARFFYVLRSAEQHLDFDLDLAKARTADNPVYYVQYAHARVCSVMRQLAERGLAHDRARGLAALGRLTEPHEERLVRTLARWPEVVESAAAARAPHQVAHYLRELANDFHVYYGAVPFLVDDAALRDARLALILAVRQTIANGLALLGVSAPERM